MKVLLLLLFPVLLQAQCLNADIAILVDWSGSEEGHEEILSSAAYSFINDLPVDSSRVRITLATFSTYHIMWSTLTGDRDRLNQSLKALSKYGASGGTNLSQCLGAAYWELNTDKRKVAHIIILITDGEINDTTETIKTHEYMESIIPAVIYAVQVGGASEGYANLLKLTGNPDNIVISTALGLTQALKALDLCP